MHGDVAMTEAEKCLEHTDLKGGMMKITKEIRVKIRDDDNDFCDTKCPHFNLGKAGQDEQCIHFGCRIKYQPVGDGYLRIQPCLDAFGKND